MDEFRTELENNFDKYLLNLNDEFLFKCRECGKCCKNREDIMLTSRDLYNIAKKLGMKPGDVVERYCNAYIGISSRMPIVRLLPRGATKACPLLRNKRCVVHDSKPTVCRLYPLGRAVIGPDGKKGAKQGEPIRAGYIIQPVECGSIGQKHSVSSWLEKFGVPVEDEFFVKWNEICGYLSMYIQGLEQRNAPASVLKIIRNLIYDGLYSGYDTCQEFTPQFETNTSMIKNTLSEIDAELQEIIADTNKQ